MAPPPRGPATFPSVEERAPAPAAAGGAAALPPGPTRKPPPTVRTEETEPPSFDALASWSRITISRRGGESRSLSRPEARELNALLGSAALSAVGPRPLAGTPEWRVTLERGVDSLAVFEISGAQVRWREGRAPPATGVPSPAALAALRQAAIDNGNVFARLMDAVRVCSLGQITTALFEVGGQYRRNM